LGYTARPCLKKKNVKKEFKVPSSNSSNGEKNLKKEERSGQSLRIIMLSEISQSQKDRYYEIPPIEGGCSKP
jgi:hypothetical protein